MPKGRGGRSKTGRSVAISTCKLPEGIVTDILSRLPVKSILRFRCVCKPWLNLFSNPKFISTHFHRTNADPANDSLVVHSVSDYHDHVVTLVRVNTIPTLLTPKHPFPEIFFQMDLVGSCNGIVCLCNPPLGFMIVLWNPATRMWKAIPLSTKKPVPENVRHVSLGLGFDTVNNDFKVVRIEFFRTKRSDKLGRAEVYSAKSETWRKIKMNFPFFMQQHRCNAIVNGNPYWTAIVKEIGEDDSRFRESMVKFDVVNEVFRMLPVMDFSLDNSDTTARIVDLKGSLAFMVYSPGKEPNKMVDVNVLDEETCCWSKKYTIGPTSECVKRPIQCSKNGELLFENDDGKLFLFYPETGKLKRLCIDGAQALSFEAFSYTESLFFINGMKQVGKDNEDDAKKVDEYDIGKDKEVDVKKVDEHDIGKEKEVDVKPSRKKRDDFLSKGFKLVL